MLWFKRKKKTKVLIVEDDALLIKALIDHLTKQKFEVVGVGNGLEVLKTTKSYKPDIILLDLILPGLDGFDVLKQLQADKVTKLIPVVVISNLSEVGEVKSALALGAKEYIIKANTQLSAITSAINKYVK